MLPFELKYRILLDLDVSSLESVSRLSKSYRSIWNDPNPLLYLTIEHLSFLD
jgi:hypothetical protein